jgi:hypothetical protein
MLSRLPFKRQTDARFVYDSSQLRSRHSVSARTRRAPACARVWPRIWAEPLFHLQNGGKKITGADVKCGNSRRSGSNNEAMPSRSNHQDTHATKPDQKTAEATTCPRHHKTKDERPRECTTLSKPFRHAFCTRSHVTKLLPTPVGTRTKMFSRADPGRLLCQCRSESSPNRVHLRPDSSDSGTPEGLGLSRRSISSRNAFASRTWCRRATPARR